MRSTARPGSLATARAQHHMRVSPLLHRLLLRVAGGEPKRRANPHRNNWCDVRPAITSHVGDAEPSASSLRVPAHSVGVTSGSLYRLSTVAGAGIGISPIVAVTDSGPGSAQMRPAGRAELIAATPKIRCGLVSSSPTQTQTRPGNGIGGGIPIPATHR